MMKSPWRARLSVTVAIGLFVFVAGCSRNKERAASQAAGLEAFYALETIPTFQITLDDQAIQALKEKPRKFVSGDFAYGGVTYRQIGVRLKGHRSMRPIDEKPSFKLRFDKSDPALRFMGQKQLTLNNLVEDPTMIREILSYRIFRGLGVPAPEVGYAQVVVNGQPYGLYAIIETVDDGFLSRNFSDAAGSLYEGEYGCDLYGEDVDGFERDNGSDDSRRDLRALAAAVAGPTEDLFDRDSSPLQMDEFLTYLAVSAYIGDFDGYRHSHNYRIYHHPQSSKWYFLPWGLDRVFKKNLDIYDSNGLLAKRCFADAGCRLEYVRTMKSIVQRIEAMHLEQAVPVVSAFVDSAARADTRKSYSDEEIDKARKKLSRFLKKRPGKIRDQLTCIDESGNEVDRDGDGHGCMDCNDADPAIHPGAAEICDQIDNDCSGLIDDGAACACPVEEIDGVTFYMCDLPMPWTEAAAFCEAQGHTLATIDNEAQAVALYQAAIKRRKDRWWIGLSERKQAGTFRWRDGSEAPWIHWAKNEPDEDGCSTYCVAINEKNSKGKWIDTHCGQHKPFICR